MKNYFGRGMRWGCLCATIVSFAGLGCSDSGGNNEPIEEPVEIFSWWTEAGERRALEEVVSLYEEEHPESRIINTAARTSRDAQDVLAERMAQGNPPDSFQTSLGSDLRQWVMQNEAMSDSDSLVESLEPLGERNGWLETFPSEVLEAGRFAGSLYGVPVNIHRINALFYNKQIFEEHDLELPTTVEELKSVSQTLQDAGVTPLALGNTNLWTLWQVTFENMLPAVGGAEYYQSFWKGQESPNDPEITETLQNVIDLWPYFNADANDLDWSQGVRRMAAGKAAMAPMGDWAKATLETEGLIADEDFGVIPFPGTSGTFVFGADMFTLTKGAPNREGGVALLEAFTSPEGQVAFNRIKGSIPTRTEGVDVSQLDAMQQTTFEQFNNATRVQALAGLRPAGTFAGLEEAVQEMVVNEDPEVVLRNLKNGYSDLQ